MSSESVPDARSDINLDALSLPYTFGPRFNAGWVPILGRRRIRIDNPQMKE
jgi:hypothetical protein